MHTKIKTILQENQTVYQEVRHDAFNVTIKSPYDFAQALNYEADRITKSVFLRSKSRDSYIMAVGSCSKKFDLPKLCLLAGINKLEVADKEELDRLVGYPVYGVSSIGLSPDIQVFMDEALLNFKTVLAGSGETAVEIELSPADLSTLSNAVVTGITL